MVELVRKQGVKSKNKTCCDCGVSRDDAEFYVGSSYCKECHKRRSRKSWLDTRTEEDIGHLKALANMLGIKHQIEWDYNNKEDKTIYFPKIRKNGLTYFDASRNGGLLIASLSDDMYVLKRTNHYEWRKI
jgi:hypothetical protein